MLPDNIPSTVPHFAGFLYQVKGPGDAKQDWEMGGKWLNDPSEGLQVKLWHVQLAYDVDTGDTSVVLDAPGGVAVGEPKRTLFSGAGISEVSLAFDQNMNPCVAYMQGSAAKLWWYDPTIPGMTHTTLPAGTYDVRFTLDDKRPFATGDSDIVLAYLRGGTLYIRYQRERFGTERVFKSGVGVNAQLVSMAMNRNSCLQSRLRKHTLTAEDGALIQVAPYLADIIADLAAKSGIAPENVDVTDLWRDTDTVPGLGIAIDDGLTKPIEWLAEMYLFDKSQHGRKLRFEHRGKPISFRIPYSDLVAKGSREVLKQTKVDGKGLPKDVFVNHVDPDAGFAKNKQSASRRSNLLITDEQVKIESRVVLTADQAATNALTVLKARWGEQYEYKFSVTTRYTAITVSDVGEVQASNGDWHRVRILEKNEDTGIIEFEAIQDAGPTVYTETNQPGNALPPPVSTSPGVIGETVFELLNIGVQLDADDELGVYIAGRGDNAAWQGYVLLISLDGGLTYVEAAQVGAPSNIGETATSIAINGDSVEVLTPWPLESVTAAAIAAGQSRAVIGDEEIQYQTATLLGMSGALYNYRLSGIVRRVLGTTRATWPAGTRFVEVDSTVIFLRIERGMFGRDIHYKAVSMGTPADDVTAKTFHADPIAAQTEWPVTGLMMTGGTTATWTGSPRLGTFGSAPYHSKYFAGYRVKFSDGHTADTASTSYTYATPPPGGTVSVCALNAITGEGPFVTIPLPITGYRVTEAGDKRITETGDYRITE